MPNSSSLPSASKLGIASTTLKAALAGSLRLCTSPFKGSNGASTYFKDVAFAVTRTQLANLDLAQDRYLNRDTTPTYLDYARSRAFEPESITLPSGTQAHWFGSAAATKILVYFHGGGYVLPCSAPHMAWLDDLRKDVGPNVSALLLAYDVAPESPYPTQLRQAVELIRYLVEIQGRNPADLIIGGDSAGGNLTLSLLSHLAHPHPEVPALQLSSKIRAALLLSPWCSMTNVHTPAFVTNAERDMINGRCLSRWSAAFLGSESPFAGDFYSEPVLAAPEWWAPVANVVDEVLIWAGANEVLLDGIEAFARKFTLGFGGNGGRVETIVTPKACHVEMIVERIVGYKGDSGTGSKMVVEDWLKAKL